MLAETNQYLHFEFDPEVAIFDLNWDEATTERYYEQLNNVSKLAFVRVGEIYDLPTLTAMGLGHLANIPRRKVRNMLFHIARNTTDADQALKAWFDSQFRAVMNWPNFTFIWDVAPGDPFKVISQGEWVQYRGMIDPGNNNVPTGFTSQVVEALADN